MAAPGVVFCVDISRRLIPTLLIHASLRIISHIYAWEISTAVYAAVWILFLPLYAQAHSAYTRLVHIREARKLGAELVPSVRGKWPGNIDLLVNGFTKQDLYVGDGLIHWTKIYGTTFAVTTLGDTRILTINPENVKRILASDFDNYVKGVSFNTTMKSVLGVGVFNSDGDMWQFHRRITRPFFAKERVTDFGIFDSKATLAIRKMQERSEHGHAMDFQDICSRFTLDSACEFLLGTSIHSLDDPLSLPGEENDQLSTPSKQFSRAFANAQIIIASRGRLGMFWRLKEFFRDKTKDNMVIIRGFIDPIVEAAMRKRNNRSGIDKHEVSLLDHLVNVTDDLNVIADEVLNIMLAGRDTTASLLTFVTYCLAMHPAVLSRLREEIINSIGQDRSPTIDDLRSLKYLRAVLNETLRLFSPVPFNVRQTIKGTIWVNDEGKTLYIPPKTRVTFSFMNMHRHEAYWGPDAHLWDPDRFLDERLKETVTSNPFIFLPFNAGPRICLGQQFAYHEVSFFIVRMLQRFSDIQLAPEAQPPGSTPPAEWAQATSGSPRKKLEKCFPQTHLTLYVKGGLWVKMKMKK
ncbi:cytochrome P450 [Ramaria rubella]|nr:cytochrome P450 [Ramaria rubella]